MDRIARAAASRGGHPCTGASGGCGAFASAADLGEIGTTADHCIASEFIFTGVSRWKPRRCLTGRKKGRWRSRYGAKHQWARWRNSGSQRDEASSVVNTLYNVMLAATDPGVRDRLAIILLCRCCSGAAAPSALRCGRCSDQR
ncbi:hypothetical protein [Bradyrhizobium sp. STM 3561]|uniref:hypothetical protein n=1 Tax=Bradyrhizobium sp. STM 3561 TaxID=578923 RepID=UPI0038907A1D